MATAVAAAITLTGCTAGGAGSDPGSGAGAASANASSAGQPGRVQTGASPSDRAAPDGGSAPRTVGTTAPAARVDKTMPFSWEDAAVVRTGWSSAPMRRDTYFVGFADPADASGDLVYSVIDSAGRVRWRAERPASCTGFAVSRAGDTPIVVLTDAAVGDGARASPRSTADPDTGSGPGAWQTTASAYDLATGERRWGPVPVPGTVQGPGLVFGASAPAATLGATGPRVALDPATGQTVADEDTDAADSVIGEYDGTVLLAHDDMIDAIDAATGAAQWTMANPVGGTPAAPTDSDAPAGAALIAEPGRDDAALVNLDLGEVLATGVSAAGYDELARQWVWVQGRTVTGFGRESDWHRELDAQPRISAIGSGLTYLRYGNSVEVLNSVTGRSAQAFPTTVGSGYAVPQDISVDGAGVFTIGSAVLLATIEPAAGR